MPAVYYIRVKYSVTFGSWYPLKDNNAPNC